MVKYMLNILYTCDDNYVWLMGISMISLFENNRDIEYITVYLLGENISSNSKLKLQEIGKCYCRKCEIIDMPKIEIPKNLITARWPKSAFSRLYAAAVLPDTVDSILYLDCDTIILGKLNGLETINLEEYMLYGVKDCISALYRKNIGLNANSLYINAGVLLFNLKKLRSINVTERIEKFLKRYSQGIHYADQDVLNGAFNEKFGIFPAEFNVMTLTYMYEYNDILKLRHPINYYKKVEIENAIRNPKIIHFTTCMLNVRPWYINSTHPMTNEFLKYKNISPWCDKQLMVMKENKELKYKLLYVLQMLPHNFQIKLLGILHTFIYPLTIRVKLMIKSLFA